MIEREEIATPKRARRKVIRKSVSTRRSAQGRPGLVIVSSHKTAAPRKRRITKQTY